MSEATGNSHRPNPIPGSTPWPPGVSGNPSGRPKLQRPPSKALAELNDTPGETPELVAANYFAAIIARGDVIRAADLKAVRAFKREWREDSVGVSQLDSTTDRLEGKVSQPQTITFDIEDAVAKAAEQFGVSPEELLAMATKMAETK